MSVATMDAVTLYCQECHEERLFERPHEPVACPDRADSPDGCCPELACADCGAAVVLGLAVPQRRTGRAAHADLRESPERAA